MWEAWGEWDWKKTVWGGHRSPLFPFRTKRTTKHTHTLSPSFIMQRLPTGEVVITPRNFKLYWECSRRELPLWRRRWLTMWIAHVDAMCWLMAMIKRWWGLSHLLIDMTENPILIATMAWLYIITLSNIVVLISAFFDYERWSFLEVAVKLYSHSLFCFRLWMKWRCLF
jgi:hypothetical protein